jgi:hypothetical protein
MPYVAISHVWADGLGSTTEEGLPLCQIKRLSAITRELVPDGAFWIDSLCVPAVRDMRNRAIGLMAQTYKDAAVVLVIDSGIRSTSISASREEKLLRVLSSGWMQRLWTLQEGLLANRLVFEFSGGLVALEELLPVGEEHFNVVLVELASEVFRLKKHRASILNISDVSQSLRWRTTSRGSDETLAISGLLRIDAFELVNLPPEQRMPAFLLQIRKLPADIIFLSGSKLSELGFRWAPKTLMRGTNSSLGFGVYDASCTPTGLLAEYVAVYFQDTAIDKQKQWYIRDSSKQRIYKVTDLWLGADAEEFNCPIAYSCNALLLMELPRLSETTVCAAVLIDGEMSLSESGDGDGDDRMTCEFRKRLLLQDITESELRTEKAATIVIAKSARMRVKVT